MVSRVAQCTYKSTVSESKCAAQHELTFRDPPCWSAANAFANAQQLNNLLRWDWLKLSGQSESSVNIQFSEL